jgi:Helix-turn-helix of DDE superfamily endonuclease
VEKEYKMVFYPKNMSDILGYIRNNPQETQRLVGVKYDQVEQLMKQAIALHSEKQEKLEAQKVRIINKGGGRQVKLSTEEQILLTLIYLRHLTTFQLLGIQFGVSESTANDTFNYWLPLLQELLPCSLLEQVKKTPVTMKLFKKF